MPGALFPPVVNEGLLMGEANRCRRGGSEELPQRSNAKVYVIRPGDVLAVGVPVPVEDLGKRRVEGWTLRMF